MADIIQLLPESIANQIAAGEVIQRPASVVKELLENSIDAQSTFVQLVLKDAGKTLVQVIDDGIGMSETDARMSLERHATSKITRAEDLFAIRTMGFRGEAMASIASIAQMIIITRSEESEMGVRLEVAGSKVKSQEYCQAPRGTNTSVKNLFFNIPARRKFLKSDPVELKHVMEEFKRVALANPEIKFSLKHNGNEVYHLNENNLRKRIINIFGKNVNELLVPISEATDVLTINGYIGKPGLAKKSRGNQFLFVNNRFIKSSYLNHAIKLAFSSLIGDEHSPFFVLFLEIDPSRIDINVHPTKTEIKFEDERLIYQYLKVSVQHGLGKYNVTPSIDFDAENTLIGNRPNYSQDQSGSTGSSPTFAQQRHVSTTEKQSWENLYKQLGQESVMPDESSDGQVIRMQSGADSPDLLTAQKDDSSQLLGIEKRAYQIHNTYVINQIKSGYLIIHQQYAHERIMYEKLLKAIDSAETVTQNLLFPITLNLNPDEAILLQKLLPSIQKLGFVIEDFGKQSYIVNGVPAILQETNIHGLLIELISLSAEELDFNSGIIEALASSIAKNTCLKKNRQLSPEEMTKLIDELFACQVPFATPSGKKCFVEMDLFQKSTLTTSHISKVSIRRVVPVDSSLVDSG